MTDRCDAQTRAMQSANAAILERLAGVSSSPANPDSDHDPQNPGNRSGSIALSDADGSGSDSSGLSDRSPLRGERTLRLVWCAS